MEKEKLINDAIESWSNYGKAINNAFGFDNFYIQIEPFQKVIETNSEIKIQLFISYIKDRIEELNQLKNQ